MTPAGAIRVLGGLLIVSLFASVALADAPTTEECIAANTKAQTQRRSGNLRAAREALLLCAQTSCPKMVRDDCTQRMDDLERAIPTIVFQAKDAQGHDLGDVKVSMDGAQLSDKLAGTALAVDVGDHAFTFAADGYNVVTQHFVIVEGQKDRHETVTLTSNAPPPPPPPQPPPQEQTVLPPPPVAYRATPVLPPPPPMIDPAAVDARHSRRTAGIVLTVIGALSLGGTVAFAVAGGQQNNAVQNGGFATAQDISNADTLGTVYNVGLGVSLAVGLLLEAIGIPLLLANLGDGTPQATVTARGLSLRW